LKKHFGRKHVNSKKLEKANDVPAEKLIHSDPEYPIESYKDLSSDEAFKSICSDKELYKCEDCNYVTKRHSNLVRHKIQRQTKCKKS